MKTKHKKSNKNPTGKWRQYVKYMMDKNPRVPLKDLLKNYKKKDYKKFCKKNCVFF